MKKRTRSIWIYMIGFYVGAAMLAALLPFNADMSAFLGTIIAGSVFLVFGGHELYMRLFQDPLTVPVYEHIEDGSNFSLGRAALTILQLFLFEVVLNIMFVTISMAAGGTEVVGLYSQIVMGLISIYYLVYKMRVVIYESWQNFKNSDKKYRYVFIGLGLVYLGNIGTAMVTQAMGVTESTVNQQMVETIIRSVPIYGFFMVVLQAPIVEEITYRGIYFRQIYGKHKILAYVVTGVIFGLLHIIPGLLEGVKVEWIMSLSYIWAGLVMAWVYAKTDSMVYSILLHALMNGISFLVLIAM
ncbi:CPBP family intramembrane glutamic endopeptidase [Erysipelothrix anatis]|uniref:CPBP family intramembrane glutamic endopeptidase n=1 Tax=Erysipelothrix anatis TaxID=2683713 RepID=UPI0013581346|nr:type II CAAX endopeptidase family protein [Erysipelothrix anatis]